MAIRSDPVDMSGFPPEGGSIRPCRGHRRGDSRGARPRRTAAHPGATLARTVGASSSILCEGSAKLSTRHFNDGGSPNESAAFGPIAKQAVRGDGRGGLRGREDARDRPSLRHELRPASFITTPTSSPCQATRRGIRIAGRPCPLPEPGPRACPRASSSPLPELSPCLLPGGNIAPRQGRRRQRLILQPSACQTPSPRSRGRFSPSVVLQLS